MSRNGPVIPEEGVNVCEGCGYILSGLPSDSRCPECAKPIPESSPDKRFITLWEQPKVVRQWRALGRVTADVILHPARFYRTLATRPAVDGSGSFARIHWLAVSALIGCAGAMQLQWMLRLQGWELTTIDLIGRAMMWVAAACLGMVATWLSLHLTTRIAARLTAWEAAYRGYRLPLPVIHRGLNYHAAHYLPVAVVVFLTVAGYQLALTAGWLDELSGVRYLYVLSIEVLAGSAYLFKTYWIGMRNMLYANG